jgi:hypothetical protein
MVSPTHKRTEGRAPVWGSEFTTKAAILQGDSADVAAGLNVKFEPGPEARGEKAQGTMVGGSPIGDDAYG